MDMKMVLTGSSSIQYYSSVALGVLFFSLLYYKFISTRRRSPDSECRSSKLPPGSMGLPIIGETLQFFVPYTSDDISPFIRKRTQRYGTVFRTRLIGKPVIVSTDPEVNRLVLMHEGETLRQEKEMLFKPWYSDSFNEIMGNDSLLSLEGSAHKYMRNLVLEEYGPERLKSLVADMERNTVRHLRSWSTQPSVELKDATSTMIHSFAVEKLFSMNPETEAAKEFKRCYDAFLRGLISFPIYFPGTSFWKCMQGRKGALKIVKGLLEQRREAPPHKEQSRRDYLDFMIGEMGRAGSAVNEKLAVDLLFLLPFASFESTSSVIVTAVNYLTKNPAALEELTREHEAILKGKEGSESRIGWKEYKSMTFTHMVINETLRLTNLVPGIFRKALKDVEVKGYLIPAGWTVMVYPGSVHLNPKIYPDPLSFNPWRWKGQQLHSGSHNFMTFGAGVRLCAGADFVKLQMAIIFHHLVTDYRWEVINGNEPVRYPGLIFSEGFHVNIIEKNDAQK